MAALIMVNAASASSWQFVGKNSDHEYYIDKDSINGVANARNLVMMDNLLQAQGGAKSLRHVLLVNCSNSQYMFTSGEAYTDFQLQGLKLANAVFGDLNTPLIAKPNTFGMSYVTAACTNLAEGSSNSGTNAIPDYGNSNESNIVNKTNNSGVNVIPSYPVPLTEVQKEESREKWLQSPEGKKYTAEQIAIAKKQAEENRRTKAIEDANKAIENAKLAKEFPYYAVISCGMNGQHINILACFGGDVQTEIELANGSNYGLYKIYQISNLGQQTREGMVINLRKSFNLKAQNSHEMLVLGVKVFNRATNQIVFQKQVARFGVISVRN